MRDSQSYQAFGEWVKTTRQDLHLTQEELGQKMGYEVSLVRKVEQGLRRPSTAFRQRLASLLKVPLVGVPTPDMLQAANIHIPHSENRVFAPGFLPSGSYIPLRANPLFTGREAELQRLVKAFTKRTVVCVNQRVVTTGQGGIGKTQLAVEFAHRYGRFFPGGVFWLNFADPATIPNEIARCGRQEHLNLSPGFAQLPLEQQVALVQRAWREPVPRLLIFDNCEEERLLDEWQPTTGGCHILVTSRCQRWDPIFHVYCLTLDVLERKQSVFLLRSFVPGIRGADAGAIAADLGDLPLALHLAGSYLSLHEDTVSPADYLDELERNGRLQHPSLQSGTLSPTRHEMHVTRTFAISLARLNPAVPIDRLALNLLALAACFTPGEPIPPELLVAALPEGADLPAAVTRLEKLGLVSVGEGGVIRLHQLIVEFVQATVNDKAAQTAVETALIHLTEQCNQTRSLYPARNWQGHLRYVTATAQSRVDANGTALSLATGWHLWLCGDYPEARTVLEISLKLHRQLYGNIHPGMAASLNGLGRICIPLNQLADGRLYQEEALTIQRQLYGEQHPLVAAAHNELALILQEMGEHPLARYHLEQAVAIRQKTLGPDHPDTGFSDLCLSLQHRVEGNYEAARQWNTKALRIAETALGPNHPDTTRALNALGMVYEELGDLAAAREKYEHAYRIRERILGGNHNDTLTTLNNLGGLLVRMGLYDEAMSCLTRALSIREQQFGLAHKSVAQSCRFLGTLYTALGDLPASLAYLQRALTIFEGACGINHPSLCNTLNHLGDLYRKMGEWQMAHDVLLRSLAIREKVLGTRHPETAVTLNFIGQLFVEMDDLESAYTHLERARYTLSQTLPEIHPSLAQNSQAMGCLMLARGIKDAARSFFEQAITVHKRVLGADHPQTKECWRLVDALSGTQKDF